VVARIVPGPPRDHGPDHDEKKSDEKKAADRIDRFTRAPTDDDADDDPDGNDNEDPEHDIPRGGQLPKATDHVQDLKGVPLFVGPPDLDGHHSPHAGRDRAASRCPAFRQDLRRRGKIWLRRDMAFPERLIR
jgi:hypothetical protein